MSEGISPIGGRKNLLVQVKYHEARILSAPGHATVMGETEVSASKGSFSSKTLYHPLVRKMGKEACDRPYACLIHFADQQPALELCSFVPCDQITPPDPTLSCARQFGSVECNGWCVTPDCETLACGSDTKNEFIPIPLSRSHSVEDRSAYCDGLDSPYGNLNVCPMQDVGNPGSYLCTHHPCGRVGSLVTKCEEDKEPSGPVCIPKLLTVSEAAS